MNIATWLVHKLKLKPDKVRSSDTRDLVNQTYTRVGEVRELRQSVLENRDYPIVGLLRNEPIKEPRAKNVP